MAEPPLSLAEAAARLGLSPAVLAVLWQQQDLPTSGAPDAQLVDPADVESLRARIAAHEIIVPEDQSAIEALGLADLGGSDDAMSVSAEGDPTDSQVFFDEPIPVSSKGGSQTVVVEGEPGASGHEVRVESGSRLDADSQLLSDNDDAADSSDTLQGDIKSFIAEPASGDVPSDGDPLGSPVLNDDVPLIGLGDGSQTDISVDDAADNFLGNVQDDDEVAVEGGGPPSSQQRDIHEVLMGGAGEGPRDVYGGGTVVGDVPEDSGHDIDVNIRDFGDFGRDEDPFGGKEFGASGISGFGGGFLPGPEEPHPYEGADDDELPLPFDNNDRDGELDDDLTDSILALDDSSGSVDDLRLPGDSLQGSAPRAPRSVNPPDFDDEASAGLGRPAAGALDGLDAFGDDDEALGNEMPSFGGASDRPDLDRSIDPAGQIQGTGLGGREMSINFDAGGSAGSGISPFDLGGGDDFGGIDSAEPPSRSLDDFLTSDRSEGGQGDQNFGSNVFKGDAPSGFMQGSTFDRDLLSSDVPSGVTISDDDLRMEGPPMGRGTTSASDAESLLGMDDEGRDDYLSGSGRQVGGTAGADLDLLDLASQVDDDGSVNSATDATALEGLEDEEDGEDALSGVEQPGSGSGVRVGDEFTETMEIRPSSIDVNEDFNDIVSVSEITTADELSPNDSALTVIDEDQEKGSGASVVQLDGSEDDEDVLLGGSSGSDITLASNESGIGIGSGLSGIGLASLSGSGIDLGNVTGYESSPSSVSGGTASQDQEFLLTPLDSDEGDESDSGSQVIALDQDSVEIESAPTMLGDSLGGPVMLGGDYGAQPGVDPLAAMAPAGGYPGQGYAPTPGLAPVVYQTADDNVNFTGGDAMLLSGIVGTMALTAILMFDVMRSIGVGSTSAVLKWIFSFTG